MEDKRPGVDMDVLNLHERLVYDLREACTEPFVGQPNTLQTREAMKSKMVDMLMSLLETED